VYILLRYVGRIKKTIELRKPKELMHLTSIGKHERRRPKTLWIPQI